MREIKEVASDAMLALVFEKKEDIIMWDITISSADGNHYQIKVPKAFIEKVYSIGFNEGNNANRKEYV